MSTPTMKLTRELVRMACLAPSIHNTQPWAWQIVGADTVELHADRSRQLPETDPDGRALMISCGSGLLGNLGHPQVLVHVGWHETSRPRQTPTPRRSLDDVLLP